MQVFTHGPFTNLTEDCGKVVVRTTVERLLKWGADPAGSNPANINKLIEDLRDMESDRHWYGGFSPDEILGLKGWAKGLEIAKRYAQDLPRIRMESIGRRPVWDVAGDEFDRDRFDAAVEECWMSRRRTQCATRPILKLTCAIGGTARRSARELMWMGAAAFAVCDAAEEAGYRIEIEACSQTDGTFDNGKDCLQLIKVKDAQEALDRETTVMAMACPAFFRWHVIRSRAAVSPELNASWGYGSTRSIDEWYHGDLHMPHAYSYEEAKEAVAYLVQRIEELNGTASVLT